MQRRGISPIPQSPAISTSYFRERAQQAGEYLVHGCLGGVLCNLKRAITRAKIPSFFMQDDLTARRLALSD